MRSNSRRTVVTNNVILFVEIHYNYRILQVAITV